MDFAEIVVIIISFVVGAMLGSFACCQTWRLRLKQLKKQSPGKWSACLSCGHRLGPFENIPIFSWLSQRGKCKHCGADIGRAEIFSELSLGLTFAAFAAFFYPGLKAVFSSSAIDASVLSDSAWYLAELLNPIRNTGELGLGAIQAIFVAMLIILAVSLVTMWILLIHDAKWQTLPNSLLVFLNVCAIAYLILHFVGSGFNSGLILNTLIATLILAGLYFCLSFFSKEKLVGSGDWLVALPIALILGNWWLALVALFLSNFLASIVGLILKFKKGLRQIPFGPFLIIAFVIVYIIQPWLLNLMSI